MNNPWQIALDVGGTFTDAVARTPDGCTATAKVLSSGVIRATVIVTDAGIDLEAPPGIPSVDGFLDRATLRLLDDGNGSTVVIDADVVRPDGTRRVRTLGPIPPAWPRGTRAQAVIDAGVHSPALAAHALTRTPLRATLPVVEVRLGSTRGTNALLEGDVAPVLFITNAGLEDVLRIGDQRRPELFAVRIVRDPPPYAFVFGVAGRIGADGCELEPIDEAQIDECARVAIESGCTAVAVCLMHSWRNDRHERRIGERLRTLGVRTISLSHALSRTIGFEARARATCINAQLSRPVGDYLEQVKRELHGARVRVMTSAGTLTDAESFHPKDSLFSGPAGGVVGARACAAMAHALPAIAFDMGGTSTDVARLHAQVDMNATTRVGQAHIASPSVAVESVAAGGGSVLHIVDGIVCVGPHSARSMPGPACYGMGGPLTITDAHALLGHLDGARFPFVLDLQAAAHAADAVLAEWRKQRDATISRDEMLHAFLQVADALMAEAIRRVSARKGLDPADHTLVAFGGAGGLHACALADALGMTRAIVPGHAGLLSAAGIAGSESGDVRVDTMRVSLHEWRAAATPLPGDVLGVRCKDQEAIIELPASSAELEHAFASEYASVFGTTPPQQELVVEWVRHHTRCGDAWSVRPAGAQAWTRTEVGWANDHCTVRTPHGWEGTPTSEGLMLTRHTPHTRAVAATASDALVAAALEGAAASMGESLRRTASSVNVRDRLDYSCGLLDPTGALIVNAPHLPVHLGALGACVRAVVAHTPLGPGDAAVTNHPAFGGSHLPDVTVVTPIYEHDDGGLLLGYAATRAHHAELGGIAPGSMPPFAPSLADEAVVLPPMLVARRGVESLQALRSALERAAHPSRAVEQNIADVRAQMAANHRGVVLMRAAYERFGRAFAPALEALRSQARTAATAALSTVPLGTVEERLDDGTPIRVTLSRTTAHAPGARDGWTVDQHDTPPLRLDFTGSGGVHAGNFNAPVAVVRSAVLYALRVMAGAADPVRAGALPLNEGFADAVALHVPRGLLNPAFPTDPHECPAVGAGNTETSQRVVDALLRLFGVCACSQGTMNNLIFGSARFGFYETIAGGAGASAQGGGESGVHTHMTNTRITDAEVLEARYPVRLRRFRLRAGSAGAGRHDGGEGVIRELEFLEPVTCSIIGQHRLEAPYGLNGGRPGAVGSQWLIRGAFRLPLPGVGTTELAVGDRVEVQTPGGGGWGALTTP